MKFASLIGVLVCSVWLAPVGSQQLPAPAVVTGPGRTPDVELRTQFDKDKNGWLNLDERSAARGRLAEVRPSRGRGAATPEPTPGRRLTPADVTQHAGAPLYDPSVLRTIFIDFEHPTWEEELETFYHTDIELPSAVRVDGRSYANVGVQFRGNSSFFSVQRGRKRSLSLSFDHVNGSQRLDGYRAITLLNAHSDPTFLRSMLYMDIAREYMPVPKVNFVRVVINGESWGVYVNQQRFNRDFIRDVFKTEDGVRYKSSNRSRGGSFAYLGESIDEYRKWYEIQSADQDASWKTLMSVTRVLAATPADQLKAAIEPILNVDGVLRYLALDMVMMSGDGYWLYGSDFNLYADAKGRLHLLYHDANEAFTATGGRGAPREAKADPIAYMDDPLKAMRHKLLAVPEYRDRYLRYVRDIAQKSLDWTVVEQKINRWRKLIEADVQADTRKLYPTEEFTTATFGSGEATPAATTLKGFILERRAYLLAHPAIAALK